MEIMVWVILRHSNRSWRFVLFRGGLNFPCFHPSLPLPHLIPISFSLVQALSQHELISSQSQMSEFAELFSSDIAPFASHSYLNGSNECIVGDIWNLISMGGFKMQVAWSLEGVQEPSMNPKRKSVSPHTFKRLQAASFATLLLCSWPAHFGLSISDKSYYSLRKI